LGIAPAKTWEEGIGVESGLPRVHIPMIATLSDAMRAEYKPLNQSSLYRNG